MPDGEKLRKLMATWLKMREQGKPISVEELCRDCPEYVDALNQQIDELRSKGRLPETDVGGSDKTVVSGSSERAPSALGLPPDITRDELIVQLVSSGFLSQAECEAFGASDAKDLADRIIKSGKLTQYQLQRIAVRDAKSLLLGNYLILDKIGAGGMGQVFKARHQRMDRIVAIKVLLPGSLKSKTMLERFHREVKVAARLEHPNIVAAYDADECNGRHYLVLQFVDGKDLATLVRDKQMLPVAQALEYTIQAATGLEYAHSKGCIHRDIKPGNILVDQEGKVQILDMGIARIVDDEGSMATHADLTQTGMLLGTANYMSPEQAIDTGKADERSDVYSLGCTLYCLLTGKPVFEAKTATGLIVAHMESKIPLISALRPSVPPVVDAVFQKMVAKEPLERYQNMTEVKKALAAAMRNLRGSMLDNEDNPIPAPIDSGDTDPHAHLTAPTSDMPRTVAVAGSSETTANMGRQNDDTIKTGAGNAAVPELTLKPLTQAPDLKPIGLAEPVVSGSPVAVPDRKFKPKPVPQETVDLQEILRDRRMVIAGSVIGVVGVVVLAALFFPRGNDPSPIPPPPPPPVVTTDDPQQVEPPTPESLEKDPDLIKGLALYQKLPKQTEAPHEIQLVCVGPGMFRMGEKRVGWIPNSFDNERAVCITKPFYLSEFEITQANYHDVYQSWSRLKQSQAGDDGSQLSKFEQLALGLAATLTAPTDSARLPQDGVSWYDAIVFCNLLSDLHGLDRYYRIDVKGVQDGRIHDANVTVNSDSFGYRLPTEAEWEFACRAKSDEYFSFGDKLEITAANYRHSVIEPTADRPWVGGRDLAPVGSYPANGFGLHDMHGNAWEWCSDVYDPQFHREAPVKDPVGPKWYRSDLFRVLAGGSYESDRWECRAASRYPRDARPHMQVKGVGFRIARYPKAVATGTESDVDN